MKKIIILVFDVMFVMILCFATLLTTMLMQGGLLVGGDGSGLDYSFNLLTFSVTFGGLFLYMIYVLRSSDKELKAMIKEKYKEGDASK
jgi:hypothetical protein